MVFAVSRRGRGAWRFGSRPQTLLRGSLAALGLLLTFACGAESAPPTAVTSTADSAGTAAGEAAAGGSTAADRRRARVETTLGSFDIELFPERAPITVEHIRGLIDGGFFNGLLFHRVMAGFVVQAGGYDRNMQLREAPATVVNESDNGLSNTKGTLAMARLQDPDSADTQWFINVVDNQRLDARPNRPGYTVFGQVIAGWDTVVDIELVNTVSRKGMAGVPETPIEIQRIAWLPAAG